MDASVVIPAHNEEAVIGGALRALRGASADELDVLVVANACTDRTVSVAEGVGDRIRVVEIPDASKILALNEGIRAARVAPVAFVDADVSVSGSTLVELARRLDATADALVASPSMHVTPSTSWWVRQYYRVWALTDYRSSGHVGSGVYMIAADGLARLGEFPDVIADDLYVQRLFAPSERLTPPDLTFRVRAPGSVRSLVRRNTRIAAGNRQLAERFPHLAPPGGGVGALSLARRVVTRPALWAGFAIYTAVYLTAHGRARRVLRRGGRIAWTRDETTRRVGA